MAREGGGKDGQEKGGDIEERKRVLRHASSLNRADVIKKVVRCSHQAQVLNDSKYITETQRLQYLTAHHPSTLTAYQYTQAVHG